MCGLGIKLTSLAKVPEEPVLLPEGDGKSAGKSIDVRLHQQKEASKPTFDYDGYMMRRGEDGYIYNRSISLRWHKRFTFY